MEKTQLLPCPFCGFMPHLDDGDCVYPITRSGLWGLHCYETGGGCGAEVIGNSQEEVIRKWNTRNSRHQYASGQQDVYEYAKKRSKEIQENPNPLLGDFYE
jgi:predicted small metal-binding protein